MNAVALRSIDGTWWHHTGAAQRAISAEGVIQVCSGCGWLKLLSKFRKTKCSRCEAIDTIQAQPFF